MSVFARILVVALFVPFVVCQEANCYGAGSLAGAAIGAFLAALLLVAVAFYLRKLYWRTRKGKHLVLTTDPENVKDEFAFDNPGFRHEERQWNEAPTLPVGGKQRPLHVEFVTPEQTKESKDDIFSHRQNRTRRVKLWARDFTGLGLRCGGGARDGVHIHSVLKSGPAAAAKLQPGDKIKSIKIELTGTPLEDAVSILSLASPYPVELEIVEGSIRPVGGKGVIHPLLKKAGSMGDVNSLEKETKHFLPKSPNASHSNNSTLESKQPKGIKKIITDTISTLERTKKEKKDVTITTLERENEKNNRLANKHRYSDVIAPQPKPAPKTRHSMGTETHITMPENGSIEHAEVQKRENDGKRGTKFGIKVLPPSIPDDGVLKQKHTENGTVIVEKRDETDKAPSTHIKHENETEVKKPVVAKRREKMAPPIPNVRTKINESDSSYNTSRNSETNLSSFARNDLNSSGIKRDANGIPQELPSHMMEAARAAKSNRKSSADLVYEKEKSDRKDDAAKPSKKSKGKAPSPPEVKKNKTDDSIIEQTMNINDFLKNEKEHSSWLNSSSFNMSTTSSDKSGSTFNTSTPKANKSKTSSNLEESINFSQDDIDDIVSKPFKKGSDSLNNYYEDSKSNLSSNQDIPSITSMNQSDKSEKGSTTIELNNSDVTIHSSPNDTLQSISDENSVILDENERKAASLGDLSRFEMRAKASKPSTGTLERAQSLDISADDVEINETNLSPKKRKANSVVETTFFESHTNDNLPDMVHSEHIIIKHKEPRLSLNIAKTSAMEGLSTFQRNRLKKGSEFGKLEDAIVKGSSSSLDSDKTDCQDGMKSSFPRELDLSKIDDEEHETSDHLAKRIMDENMKVHLKLVSEFAKSTSDGSNLSSLDSSREQQSPSPSKNENVTTSKYEDKTTVTYDTNIPDDMKVSRSSYVNSLERPKSELMKKLLAKNPILNVHIDHNTKTGPSSSQETPTPMTDASKSAMHQPDIVNFDLKNPDTLPKDYDDYVSNINVGSNNNSLKHNKKPDKIKTEWADMTNKDTSKENIVTITTEKNLPTNQKYGKSYTKNIEIGEPVRRLNPDLIEGIKRKSEEREARTLYMQSPKVALTMTQEPVQKTVTVNVAEDDYGNKIITQNVEKVSTKYMTATSEAPLEIEQVTFGIMKNSGRINEQELEEGDVKDIDKSILNEIKRQNPHMHFTTDEPSYTKTETIILNTSLDEKEAVALMDKIKNDPSFMSQKTPEELSELGIRIIRDLEDTKHEEAGTVEVSKTRYKINPGAFSKTQNSEEKENSEHITEIQVVTPRTEKMQHKTEKDKIASRQRAPPYEEPPLSNEIDIDLLTDFISNEKYHSAKQQSEILKRTKARPESKNRHSDFDLPRNTQIKFRTATYESPKGTIVTSTDIENRRQSEQDQMQLRAESNISPSNKPSLSAKPSNIPVKMSEKPKVAQPSSKIPVFTTQKSLSSENLADRSFSLPRSPPPTLSSSSGNISVTSIKSSSKHPSGKF